MSDKIDHRNKKLISDPLAMLPAHYAVQSLLDELFVWLERRLDFIANNEPIEKPLNKSIRRGDDSHFINLLRSLNGICETCLPSVLQVLIKWYEHQQQIPINEIGDARDRTIKRTLMAGYLFCIILIEILPQVHFHPNSCDSQINFIINNSFKQISYRDPAVFGKNYDNNLLVTELFAEIIGILSQSHSKQIQNTFLEHLNEYRKEIPSSATTTRSIISLLMGMKFFRVKTNQVSEFEVGISFLNELGSYFLEVDLKQKDLKHALGGLLVEILLPMAAQIKTETNIPALISFVDKLYGPTYDLINKKQHKMAAYPLLTCLLCISQNKFFLSTWVQFLNLTLANLKNKDSKISRMALESLYRLIWVYIIRISCEGNTATRSRLESICGSLFPRGSRNVVPRDAPLNIFVKIIHFIAQFKADFAFKEIIFDLMGCNRASRQLAIYPERMNIGIRAFMVIVDGLQQKESPPGLPRSMVSIPSGTVHRIKRSYITRPLTLDTARSIGLEQYYPHCRKAFDAILRTLDTQIGRSLMLTAPQMRGKEYDDIVSADIKAKLDLFRTCIAAIPRLLPDPMTHQDLIEFLTRMCIHVDEELRATACQSLQNLISECPEWRIDIIHNFLRFFTNSIQDTFPSLIESMMRLLLQLLLVWKSHVILEQQRSTSERDEQNLANGALNILSSNLSTDQSVLGQPKHLHSTANVVAASSSSIANRTSSLPDGSPQFIRSIISSFSNSDSFSPTALALHCVEGLCIVLLCQLRPQIKKVTISLLREVKQLMELLAPKRETALIDVLEAATPYVVDKYVVHVSVTEKCKWQKDFTSISERLSQMEPDLNLVNADFGNEYMRWDAWACALSGYCEKKFLPTQCSVASSFAWPIIFVRFTQCNQFIDPNNPQNESRSSLLRSSKNKASNWTLCGEMLNQENYLSLWQKYLVMVFSLCHSNVNFLPNSIIQFRSMSPCLTLDSTEVNRSMISSVRMTRSSSNCAQLLQKAVMMIRWEATDMADSVVLGIGSINPECFEFLIEEFASKGILRELQERKNDTNMRRRKRKDLLRLQILRIIELALFRGLFEFSTILERHSGSFPQSILELFDSIRFHVESDCDHDQNILTNLRLHFAKTISLAINIVPVEQRVNLFPSDLRRSLFFLFLSWVNRTINTLTDRRRDGDVGVFVEQRAIQAMCALTSVGSMFECQGTISDEESTFRWLEALLSSTNPIVDDICEETLCIMLHSNEHHPRLLERILQLCYTKSDLVSVRCFRAISLLFSQRDFPCEYISLLCLCQSFVSDIESSAIRQTAFLLFQLVCHQFLNNITFSPNLTPISEMNTLTERTSLFPTNQLTIAKYLSQKYPQITMSIFSEICFRIESARPSRQLSLLTILPEWLRHVQLVDPNCDIVCGNEQSNVGMKSGWGSEESTQLILNNLLYLTAKLANEHNNELQDIWRCLATSWPSNMAIIVYYLFVMLSLSLENMLPLAKKVCLYLLNSNGDLLVSILVGQLQRVGDPFKALLCRSEMPPFFRWQPNAFVQKNQTETEEEEEETNEDNKTIFEEDEEAGEEVADANADFDRPITTLGGTRQQRAPNQLPMPPYGGNYSRLSAFLPPAAHLIQTLSRNNMAMFLLDDLIVAESEKSVDWNLYLPKILHIAILNLDAHRSITCFHARQTLINICVHFSGNDVELAQMANIILKNQYQKNDSIFGSQSNNNRILLSHDLNASSASVKSNFAQIAANFEKRLFSNELIFSSREELIKALLFILSNNQHLPLWEYEEVSQRCWRPESVKRLECLVRYLANYLQNSIPNLILDWNNFAIDFAISSSNRHLAGRSFQTVGTLGMSPAPFLHRIISRLTEVVGDNSEETQTYITDMFLCLQNLAQNMVALSPTYTHHLPASSTTSGHSRSISYTQQISPLSFPFNSPLRKTTQKKDMRHSLLIGNELLFSNGSANRLSRSRSATTLKLSDSTDVSLSEEDINSISQLLFIAVAMLESNSTNEFLLGLSLLDKLMLISGRDRLNSLIKFGECVAQHGWIDFAGIVGFCLKGALYPSGYEWALSILCKCIPFLHESVVSACAGHSFPLIIIASLPYFVKNFDSPTHLSSNLAQAIALHCQTFAANDGQLEMHSSSDHPICNLITMMNQFRDHTFPRDRTQWVKCVINYLVDAFKPDVLRLILFLTEMLDKCPASLQPSLLDMLQFLFTYGDLNDSSPSLLNTQVIRVITKHVHGLNNREASKILQTIVDQWNLIAIDRISENEKTTATKRKPEFDLQFEKILGVGECGETRPDEAMSKYKVRDKLIKVLSASGFRARSPKHSSMLFSQSSNDIHYQTTQGTVKPGPLPVQHQSVRQSDTVVSPATESADNRSVPSSEDAVGIDRLSSSNSLIAIAAHSGTNGGGELASLRTTDSFPRVFKEFDFLEAENDSVSESTESCFNWLSTMRTPRCGVNSDANADEMDDGNQYQEEEVQDEEDYYNDEEDDGMDPGGVFDVNRAGIGNFGSPKIGGIRNSRYSLDSNSSYRHNSSLIEDKTTGKGRRKKRSTTKRPISRTSGSNDVSSDRTPIQSSKHSDEESTPSCSLSEDENIEEGEEQGEEKVSLGRRRSSVEGSKDEGRSMLGMMMMVEVGDQRQSEQSPPSAKSPSTASSSARSTAHNHHQQLPSASNDNDNNNPLSRLPYAARKHSTADSTITTDTSARRFPDEETSSSILHFRTVSLNTPDGMKGVLADGIDRRQQQRGGVNNVMDTLLAPLECTHHISGSVEHNWNSLVARLGNDQDGELTSSLIILSTQLLRESVVRLASILRDASHLLTNDTSFSFPQMSGNGGVSTQLGHSLHVVLKLVDCPFLFATPLFLRSSDLLTSQKFALFEIREHFDTFTERRTQAIRALNSVKSSLKLMIINGRGGENSHVNVSTRGPNDNTPQFRYCNQQEVLLCKSLHRLCFQLLLMLEKLLEMVQFVQQSANSREYDLTPAVVSLHRDLLAYQASSAVHQQDDAHSLSDSTGDTIHSLSSLASGIGGEVPVTTDWNQARDTLVLHTTNKQFRSAFSKLALLRSHYCNSNGQFGCCEQTNVDVLLLHFCRSHQSLRMWALIGPLEQLRCWCSQLKEANIQLGILVRNMMMMAQGQQGGSGWGGTPSGEGQGARTTAEQGTGTKEGGSKQSSI